MKPFLTLFLLSLSLGAQPVAIRGARVFDGTGAPARQATVVINGGKIESVSPDTAIPPGTRIIDAAGQTLLPGIFDLHTHLSASAVSGLSGDWGKSLKAYLACGVTTVNDYATNGEMFAPMRQLLSGGLPGPHVNLAVRMSTPGGHGTEAGWGDFMTLTAATPEQAHAQAKIALSYKPDIIKVFTDGWRYNTAPNLSSMNRETLAAIVQDAHAARVKVVTHTVTLEGAKIAAAAGVDVLVHGIGDRDVDDELIALMKASGTAYVPTLAVYEFKGGAAPAARVAALLEPEVGATLRREASASPMPAERKLRWQHLMFNVKRLFDAGIPIALGTDAGMPGTYHGYSTLRELELLVQSGFTPPQALATATSVSARVLGVDGQRGTISPGMAADLVLVDGRPDERISDVMNTRRVWIGGKEFAPRELEQTIQSREMTAMATRKTAAAIDDMEDTARTQLGTLRVNATDTGVDHSAMMMLTVAREGGGHALLVSARLADREHPYVRAEFPLTQGAIRPADLSAFSGVSFEVRGEAAARLLISAYHVRGSDAFAAPFTPSATWQTVKIPFTALTLRTGAAWDPKDARTLQLELSAPPAAAAWLELDNLRFY
ncbi:MAG: amidohydrolase family protein [Candidatus Solibacter sp.]